ncbi:uncharacterized protein LOC118349415 [Juglans regia]|uniref:Uncharacterized protein LOC118349415 n=1 Tax=Juglans regia TaxID=51240 RepID=A0A6P9F185_JUGRE|nr:uncharacterized protein LOC118349415 [Juglans regia]
MPPRRRERNVSDLNATNNEREANTSSSEVLRAAAHQLIDDLAQNPSGLQRNNSEGGCTFKQFNSTHPPTFDGRSDSNAAEDWMQDIEEIFSVLECTDQQKVRFAAFKLIGEAKRWWNSEKAIREADGTGVVSWPHFKQNFFDRFFPRADREARAREFANLVQGIMTIQSFSELVHKAILVEQNIKRGVELQETRKRTTLQGSSGMDQGPWKKRNEGSNSGQKRMQGFQSNNLCNFCNSAHTGECRKEMRTCFRCGKSGHFIKDCPLLLSDNRKPNPPLVSQQTSQGNNQRRMGPARVFALTSEDAEDDNNAITGTSLFFSLKALCLS